MPRFVMLLLVLACPATGFAEQFPVAPGLVLALDLPGPDWQFLAEPPAFLIEETVAHVRHHLAEEGKVAPEGLAGQVTERLRQNEVFLVRPQTAARLLVDFSPNPDGEPVPNSQIVEQSARYAAAELEGEPDVSELRSSVTPGELTGAGRVWKVQASYLQDGEPRQFLGVIGFVGGSWMFLYYTDQNRDPGDLDAVRRVLGEGRIVTR